MRRPHSSQHDDHHCVALAGHHDESRDDNHDDGASGDHDHPADDHDDTSGDHDVASDDKHNDDGNVAGSDPVVGAQTAELPEPSRGAPAGRLLRVLGLRCFAPKPRVIEAGDEPISRRAIAGVPEGAAADPLG